MTTTALEGYHMIGNGWEIVANHQIMGVTPEQITWWWDNIDTTERYKQWHPSDHVSFEWLVPPAQNGHVGAVQHVVESLGIPGAPPATFDIRWVEAFDAPAEYKHRLFATAIGQKELAGIQAKFLHEYEATPGGTRMRSHFWLPSVMPEAAIAGLYRHNRQEMANLSLFLPGLFSAR